MDSKDGIQMHSRETQWLDSNQIVIYVNIRQTIKPLPERDLYLYSTLEKQF